MEWQDISTAPKDIPLMLFARSQRATASMRIIGWYLDDLGWIELALSPNIPVGIVPSHWLPLPEAPAL
jgi:hypothetical protein